MEKSFQWIFIKNDFVAALASKYRGVEPHATWFTIRNDVCISSIIFCLKYKGWFGVAGNDFDGRGGAR